ncbi:hypothetical protein D9M72_597060 [compost metagenome]
MRDDNRRTIKWLVKGGPDKVLVHLIEAARMARREPLIRFLRNLDFAKVVQFVLGAIECPAHVAVEVEVAPQRRADEPVAADNDRPAAQHVNVRVALCSGIQCLSETFHDRGPIVLVINGD